MLLSFPNRDHADVLAGDGCLHIGGRSDNDVVLTELRDRHARLTQDSRGIVLEILDGGARAHVNARPVREKAFVRYGDTVCLDAVTIAVMEAERLDDEIATGPAIGIAAPLRGVLRGMSGSAFGKSFQISNGVVIGQRADGSIELGARVSGVILARIESAGGEPMLVSEEVDGSRVNGRSRVRARLRSGDQLVFGRERFVIESCSGSAVPLLTPQVEPLEIGDEVETVESAEAGGIGHAVWWLIAAAAVMGLILAAVLRQGV